MRNTSRGQYSADLVAKRQKVDMWGGQQPVPIRRQDYVGGTFTYHLTAMG